MSNKIGLYIHIPFCKRKCFYCDFVSYQNKEELIDSYIESLKQEIRMVSKYCNSYKFTTIYIGGGTPTYLGITHLCNVLNECNSYLNLEDVSEISIESNPGTINMDNLKILKSIGINRLSIGLQATQNDLLHRLGRIHTFEEFMESYLSARKAGFKNINIDLIFGLPGQTILEWENTLKSIIDLKPEHISCYSLKIEEKTPYFELYNRGLIKLPSEDEEREMYHLAILLLQTYNYIHYEISNFCLPGYECKHNIGYWQHEEYIGIGVGAHSYFQNIRFHNEISIENYINEIKKGNLPRRELQIIDIKEAMSEFIILGLRLIKGINKLRFKQKFGIDIELIYKDKIEKLVNLGLLENDKDYIKLTLKGIDLANQVMIEFI